MLTDQGWLRGSARINRPEPRHTTGTHHHRGPGRHMTFDGGQMTEYTATLAETIDRAAGLTPLSALLEQASPA